MLKDRLDMYKETYNKELERREKLVTELTIPIAIITVLFGSISYIIGKIESISGVISLIIYIIGLLTLLVSLSISVFFTIKSYHNYKYKCIATSKQMETYYNQCAVFYNSEEETERAFQEYLIRDYCECNETNTLNNDTKAAYLHKSRNVLIISLIACAVVIVTCNYQSIKTNSQNCYNKFTQSKEEIKDGSKISKSSTKSTTPTSATTPSATTNKSN